MDHGEHQLVLTGPYPYFSAFAGGVWFAECTCGTWSAGKDSERNLRKRYAEHAKAKTNHTFSES